MVPPFREIPVQPYKKNGETLCVFVWKDFQEKRKAREK